MKRLDEYLTFKDDIERGLYHNILISIQYPSDFAILPGENVCLTLNSQYYV